MSLDVGTVGHDLARRGVIAGQGGIDALPDALARPAIEAIVDRGVGAIVRRAIAPWHAGAQHVDDAAQHAPIVDPPGAAKMRQQTLDRGPLLIIEPKQSVHGESPPTTRLNHKHSY